MLGTHSRSEGISRHTVSINFPGLYHPFGLTIGLWMKCSIEQEIRSEQVEHSMPELANKTWIPVRYDDLWETVYPKDIVDEDLGIFDGCDLFVISNEMHHFCQFVHEDHNGRKPI